jgi:hypothetical protein
VTHVKGEEPEGTGGWSRGAINLKDGVSNVTVRQNEVYENDGLGTGSGRGLGVDGISSNITITENSFRDNAGGGIKVMGTTIGWRANDNCIHGNTGYGAENTTAATLDFEDNWWSDSSGPSGSGPGSGDAVSTKVDFTPWLTTPPSACAAAVGGIMEIQVGGADLAVDSAAGSSGGSPVAYYIALAGAAAAIAVVGAAWYARRRWLR